MGRGGGGSDGSGRNGGGRGRGLCWRNLWGCGGSNVWLVFGLVIDGEGVYVLVVTINSKMLLFVALWTAL